MTNSDQTIDYLHAWYEGDNEALGRLLEENLAWMQLYVRRELDTGLRRRLDSVDLVQEGVARLLQRGPRYAPRTREEFRALLAKVIQGALGDGRDRERAMKRDVGREQALPSQGLSRFVPGGQNVGSPASQLGRAEENARMEASLDELDADDAAVLRLRHTEELEFAEIAERLGLSGADTARMRYHRALPRLGRVMERRRSE